MKIRPIDVINWYTVTGEHPDYVAINTEITVENAIGERILLELSYKDILLLKEMIDFQVAKVENSPRASIDEINDGMRNGYISS